MKKILITILNLFKKKGNVFGGRSSGDMQNEFNDIIAILGGTGGQTSNWKTYEDTSFVAGDSPRTLDFNTDLGRNATKGYLTNDGAGDITIQTSHNGSAFGDSATIKQDEVINFSDFNMSIDSLKITHVTDSSYRVIAI